MVMENEIKKIYNTLSGGKIISDDNYIISPDHFSSVLKDRFSAELSKRGIKWNGNDIAFSNLFNRSTENNDAVSPVKPSAVNNVNLSTADAGTAVGIDIQEINELPDAADYWEDEFYKLKFTPEEIAYCVSKDNPKQTFAGLYSCKEALIKCDNELQWDSINVSYDENGKPQFGNYSISISHSGLYSVAIAIKLQAANSGTNASQSIAPFVKQDQSETNQKASDKKSLYTIFTLLFFVIAYLIYRDFVK
jgi:phosphopantetheine--protein transferase-like protein